MPYKDPEQYKNYQRQYREKHRSKARDTTQKWRDTEHGRSKMLLNRYGITLEQYNELLEKQLHACAICKEPESQISWGKTKRLAVDHCHKTGKVRGLLCQRCNTTLGRYEDDLYVWENFVSYLSSFEVE